MLTPLDFSKLPQGKQLDKLVKLYISCTQQKFTRQLYFKMRTFINNKHINDIQKVYEYLYDFEKEVGNIPFWELVEKAEKYRIYQIEQERKKKISEMKVEEYKEYSLEDIMNL